MASDLGNAVTARWVGPSGHQLYDGTILQYGTVVEAIGYDEAKDSSYWEIVDKPGSEEIASNVADNRDDWSFHTEEGGPGTGRPGPAGGAPVVLAPPPPVVPDPDDDDDGVA